MADKKVSDLVATDDLNGNATFLVVTTSGGTATSNKITMTNLFANVVPVTAFKANTTFTGTTMSVSANLVLSNFNVLTEIQDRYQVANANLLINDRMQVANATLAFDDRMTVANTLNLFGSIQANLAQYMANTNLRFPNYLEMANASAVVSGVSQQDLTDESASITSSLTTLINDRMQVANTITLANARLGATSTVALTGDVTASATAFSSNAVSVPTTLATTEGSTLAQYLQVANTDIFASNANFNAFVANTNPRFRPENTIHASFTFDLNGTSDAWSITGSGAESTTDNETLYLYKGFTYEFINSQTSVHPLQILNTSEGTSFANGVSGSTTATQLFTVPHAQISDLVYESGSDATIIGVLKIVS
jgi:hypothetical protein